MGKKTHENPAKIGPLFSPVIYKTKDVNSSTFM